MTVRWRMMNSKSRACRRARAGARGDSGCTGEILPLTGLHGADFRANKARAPVSSVKSAIFLERRKRLQQELEVMAERQSDGALLLLLVVTTCNSVTRKTRPGIFL